VSLCVFRAPNTLNELNAISPIDGRYRNKTLSLAPFSEEALIKYRVLVEIEYFIALCEVPLQLKGVNPNQFDILRNIYKNLLRMRYGSKKQRK
jgi:adenylosuccinate lyase